MHSFASRGDALSTWKIIVSSQLFIALAIALLNEDFEHNHILLYLSGSALSALVGYICLKQIKDIDNDIKLERYHGYIYEKPKVALVFLFACLGLVGLPFTPTFIGIDLLFSHIHKIEVLMITIVALSFLFIELAVLRIYARIFLGQHKKLDHPVAYRSS
jgi:NADH:ubiquinone oxidoreductase subunit 4 (subunit M)